jgi:hypothetical protein
MRMLVAGWGPCVIDCRRLQRLDSAVAAVCVWISVLRQCQRLRTSKRISPHHGFSDKKLQTSDNAALGWGWSQDWSMAKCSIARKGLVLLNDYCVCSVLKAINAATGQASADSVGLSKGSRSTYLLMHASQKQMAFLGGLHAQGVALDRLLLSGQDTWGCILLPISSALVACLCGG